MGLLGKVAGAKSNQGGDYSKPGQYFIIIENVKLGSHQVGKQEFVAFETRYLHITDKALWTGDPAQVPKGKDNQPLLNIPGKEPKVGEPASFVFKDGVLGNENRLKAFILKALDMTDADWTTANPTEAAGEANLKVMCDPAIQPLRNVVIEVKAGEQTTRSKEKLVGARPLRRVYAQELVQMANANQLAKETIELLQKDNRIQKMLDQEAREQQQKAASRAAGQIVGPGR